MARPRKANSSGNQQRKDNLSSLSTEVLKLRLQALHLPVTGSRATLIAALRAAQSGGSARSAPKKKAAGRIAKRSTTGPRSAPKRSVAGDKNPSSQSGPADTDDEIDDLSSPSDHEDALSGEDSDPDILIQPQAPSNNPQRVQSGFSDDQLAVIRNAVQVSVQAALASQNGALGLPSPGFTAPATFPTPGLATPLGLNRPLDKTLEDRILRGEYIDFSTLLPDSIHQAQLPDIQFRLADSSPGPVGSPITMVRKRKPVIDSFQKWIDAFTTYSVVIVAAYPRRALELLKYQQIISLAATKFKGFAWLSYDEQFRRRAAHHLTLSWDKIDLELWAITFSGLARPHCSHCSSPHHLQGDCPLADPSRRRRGNSHCYDFNRISGCSRRTCPFPHVCSRCSSTSHSFSTCPQKPGSSGTRTSHSERPKK